MDLSVLPQGQLHGQVVVPGDKSITHRAIILAALAEGQSTLHDFLAADDCLNTLKIMSQLGVRYQIQNDCLSIEGVGLHGLQPASTDLDCGNSGTSMRLLSGLLSAQPFKSVLKGDDSLSQRPMKRIVEPLRKMGLEITGCAKAQEIYPPLSAGPSKACSIPIEPFHVKSAQIKSGLLLAALALQQPMTLIEDVLTRDHTERMLKHFGVQLEIDQNAIKLYPGPLKAQTVLIPGCLSSAAFFITAASMIPGAHIQINHVGINERRMGFIHILKAMGANIMIHNPRWQSGEYCGDIEVIGAQLQGIDFPEQFNASAIDEFPILFVACVYAQGKSTIRHVQELRVKESDRIHVMAKALQSLGAQITELPDGLIIEGTQTLQGGVVDSAGDHRCAMSLLIAGMNSREKVTVQNCAPISTSFPNFCDVAASLGLEIKTAG